MWVDFCLVGRQIFQTRNIKMGRCWELFWKTSCDWKKNNRSSILKKIGSNLRSSCLFTQLHSSIWINSLIIFSYSPPLYIPYLFTSSPIIIFILFLYITYIHPFVPFIRYYFFSIYKISSPYFVLFGVKSTLRQFRIKINKWCVISQFNSSIKLISDNNENDVRYNYR